MAKQYYAAIILIAIGVVLFLEQLDVLYLSKGDYLIYGAIIGGIFLFINGLNRIDKKGILGGTFLLSFGVVIFLMRTDYFIRDDEFGFATFFLCLALANFVFFLFKRERLSNVVFGLIFGVIGGGFLIAYLGYYPYWMLFDQIEKFWPLALILLGIAVLYKSLRKNDKVSLEHQ
ncbi:LiaI-LiaF-like domain-containing protein [Calditrichota bacterium]